MAPVKDLSGPWNVTTTHPAAGEHEGHALGIVAGQDDEPISNDTVEVHVRYASCSCGWSGQLRTAPGAREQPLRPAGTGLRPGRSCPRVGCPRRSVAP
ncbi:hypothetical protein [Pseudonocardia sp. Ae717_Ps2]|uniref:hypothetical protein n=1 Tax=Pseudonocardia sp. Ae717_Ps2 TaxID=1885573 RepID=UPI001185B8EF|nr:hypothetical protein [Pseudonocardia sp. Ae717_Ps2]